MECLFALLLKTKLLLFVLLFGSEVKRVFAAAKVKYFEHFLNFRYFQPGEGVKVSSKPRWINTAVPENISLTTNAFLALE